MGRFFRGQLSRVESLGRWGFGSGLDGGLSFAGGLCSEREAPGGIRIPARLAFADPTGGNILAIGFALVQPESKEMGQIFCLIEQS